MKNLKKPNGLFTREQILGSKRYEGQEDLIRALLPPGAEVTLGELDRKIQDFRKGEVK